jgi:hypothetical protein
LLCTLIIKSRGLFVLILERRDDENNENPFPKYALKRPSLLIHRYMKIVKVASRPVLLSIKDGV